MSDKENEEIYNITPPGRRRKRTIMSDDHPDINAIAHERDENGVQIENEDEISEDNESGKKCDTDSDDNANHSPVSPVVFTLNGVDNTDNDAKEAATNDVTKDAEQKSEESVQQQQPPNDIIYDDTKPRRLHPKNLKLDVRAHENNDALRDSISYLISPDEPDERSSPTRRRAKQFVSAPDLDQHVYTDVVLYDHSDECVSKNHADNRDVEMVKRAHYDRSPETRRRKCSSPVQRLIVKNGQTAVAVAARGRERKSSSEARLVHSEQVLSPDFNMQRQRKISSDARLEHRPEEQFLFPSDPNRRRKVSFDTTTLINGNKVMPLNDGPRLSFQEEPEYFIEECGHADNGLVCENGPIAKPLSPPKIICSCEDDERFEQSDKDCSVLEKSNSDISEEGEEGYASGHDNKGFTADDEESLPGAGVGASVQTTDLEAASVPMRRVSPARTTPNSSDLPAVISHTTVQTLPKKISSASLPTSFGRRVSSMDEMYTPKSILKVRCNDGESLASEDSIAGKTFKVRKDSIALFMDSNGSVAIEELRKEYSHRRWKCFGKADVKRLWSDRQNLLEKYKLHILVLTLFLMTFAFVVVGLHFHSEHHKNVATQQKIFFDGKTRVLSLTDVDSIDTFTGKLGIDIPYWKHPTHCYSNFAQIYDKTCLKWKEHGRLELAYFLSNNTSCYNVTWNMLPGTHQHDCYSIGSGYWYGPINTTLSQWPLSSDRFSFQVNKAKHYGSGTFSSAVEYYWISSNGHAIIVDSNYPLEINWNWQRPNSFCIKARKDGDFYYETNSSLDRLHYTVCNGKNIVETHRFIRNKFYPAVSGLPDKSFIEFPHWSSVWDSYDFILNQTVVQHVARELIDNNLNCSSVEIDGKWEANFGDITFNKNNFENITQLVNGVNKAGCDPALNIYPFFNYHSNYFQEGLTKQYFVKDVGEAVPALLRWQYGVGAMLDVSNPDARDWYTSKVRKVASDNDIKTFRLAYGSLAWVPHKPVFQKSDTSPNEVKQMFSAMVSAMGNVIVQSTSQSQHISNLLGIPSNIIVSTTNKCIRNIIPDVLNLGLMGYPFVMSDGFSLELKFEDSEHMPNRDLFIRWMQLSAFLPAMRYTLKPWSFDQEVVEVARNLSDFHSKNIVSSIFKVKDKIMNGEPIIKPLWWDNSADYVTFTIGDQFIVADRYLVAPVLCEMDDQQRHLATRNIYIPDGVWKDMGSQKIILGPRWIEEYKVAQLNIPYFEKMDQYGDK